MKIKAYTKYNERTNSRYYQMFEVEDNMPVDTYHGEKIVDIRPAHLDCEQNYEVSNYDFSVVITIDEEGENTNHYICIEHADRLTFDTDFSNSLGIYTHDAFGNIDQRITINGDDEYSFLRELVENWSNWGLAGEPTEEKIKKEWKDALTEQIEGKYDFFESRSYGKVVEMIMCHFGCFVDYALERAQKTQI